MTNSTRRGWGVSVTPRPVFTRGKDPVPIVQDAGWAPGPVRTGAENLVPTGIRSPDRPARSQSLYRQRYITNTVAFKVTCAIGLYFHEENKAGIFNTLRTGDADLRFYVTTVQDGWRRFAFLTRWHSVHLQVLLSATPQGGEFPEISQPQALLGSLMSISWKFQFTKIVSEFVINF